ncbi:MULTISPECIES: lipocalin-like domain-containing protein [Olivibacter]|uniref:Lipocalin family protein n=1 Tax=Olivibacter jilunii TaxID=985016 RepID=A0ABW6B446_9SPHI|nr:lipocalin family protein [Olivibacter sp. UJ_SKK_5.1]MDX3915746.1 lipocalin family protein [Pseudosphingobacterium sp.]
MNKEYLKGKWVHSFEEDSGDEMVYRPEGFSLPLARGRDKINLEEDGKLVNSHPGRDDVPRSNTGSWQLEQDKLILRFDTDNKEQYTICEISTEKLVLKREV